jgi:excisionase family DNA binding protein
LATVVAGRSPRLGAHPCPAITSRRFISLGDAADALAVSTRTLRRYIIDGQIDAVRIGRKMLRILVDSVERSSTRGQPATGADAPFRCSCRAGSLPSNDLRGRAHMDPADPLTGKRMRLRCPGVCRVCGIELAARQEAVYERASKTVRCPECPTAAAVAGEYRRALEVEPDVPALDSGAAGASAQREYERRKTKREERMRTRHPKLGGLILALSEDPQSTKAWASGARGEAEIWRETGQAGVGLDRGSA